LTLQRLSAAWTHVPQPAMLKLDLCARLPLIHFNDVAGLKREWSSHKRDGLCDRMLL